ncbi:MAG: hypothetical protein BGO45_13030 [Microbacterium sp. 71-36]|uniref:DUF2309 domain-containing protein n=2 Tax=Microbacterium TaxID=33882 RepID=UPI00086B9EF4|nr:MULTISPECIES: DUF2309 domain-containing protein [unclassified Microbacterium]ODT37669.1 MAG: hypothetical protein ABS60_12470 [Microbacterium sp. SCN 71-17]OJV77665.1 MAG: hypothetical protein BGO45_13030 [Microbacterium sp. 71-36]
MTTTAPATRRALIRGWVTAAGRAISPHYALETFIARSPVAAYEHLAREDALRAIAREHGILLTPDERRFRELHVRGRISDDDLVAALRLRVPETRSPQSLTADGRITTIAEILLHDLHVSPPATPSGSSMPTPARLIDPAVHARVDDLTGRWMAAVLGTPAWSSPVRRDGMWAAWRRLAALDPTLPRRVRAGIRTSADDPADAIDAALVRWGVDDAGAEAFLRAHVLAQPGWAAVLRTAGEDVDLTSLLAVRVTLERLLLPAEAVVPPPPAPAREEDARLAAVARALDIDPSAAATRALLHRVLSLVDAVDRLAIWEEAYERAVVAELAPPTAPVLREVAPSAARPLAQAVFCIDPRSEGLRRHLEAAGEVETLGFAGFFAVPLSFRPADGSPEIASCPVLLTPRVAVTESSVDRAAIARWRGRREAALERSATVQALEKSTVAPYAFAETAGWVFGAATVARTFAPRGWGLLRARARAVAPPTHVDADVVFRLEERVLYAETALRMMGLVDGFARIVLLCGHGASVANNPFASSLQCGACGGHEGEPNARAAAMIFNDPATRAALVARGIRIPDDTLFIAAQHDTVTDEVTVLEPWRIPATHESAMWELARVLDAARQGNVRERAAELPGAVDPALAVADTARRSVDWAEAYPEWGLAGNAVFIVGPRSITRGRDLGRRAFLHSYDAAADPDGAGLETILTAPMIVAQWINAQYAASTVAPDRFGAGPKPLHNVVGAVGVLSGFGGDVRLGLPWQSVGVGRDARHEPVRLQVFVQAPLARINEIVQSSEVVRNLVVNRWITLRAREQDTDRWMRFGTYGWKTEPGGHAPADLDLPVSTDDDREKENRS